jgi:hypothetical protein
VLAPFDFSKKLYYEAYLNIHYKYNPLTLNDQFYFCNKCKNSFQEPILKFAFVVKFTDLTRSIKATVFDDPILGKLFTGMEINEIVQITKENDMNKLRNIISKQFYQHF